MSAFISSTIARSLSNDFDSFASRHSLRFGKTKSGTDSLPDVFCAAQPVYSATTNRMTTLNGLTVSYDANGNLLSDGVNTYTWNADGRPTKLNSTTWTLDAFGRPVERSVGSGFQQAVYIPTGDQLAFMTGQTFFRAWVPLPGGATAVYDYSVNNGLYFYRHPDWLGTSRVTSTPSRTFSATLAYMPFGETYLLDGNSDFDFTGQNSNNVPGVYDFPAREYSSTQGRWLSPDPAGMAAVDSTDPQTWNRYAYVRNSPLNTTDPFGLDDDPGECFFDPFCNLTGWGYPAPTPSSFLPDSNPPIDWQTILFGPIDPSLVIFNWNACYNVNGKLVPCSDPSVVVNCDDASQPNAEAPQQPPGWCASFITQSVITKLRSPTNNEKTPQPLMVHNACYAGNSLTDKGVRFFSLVRLPETWAEWLVGGAAKFGLFETAVAGAKSAGGAGSLGAPVIKTIGKGLAELGSIATVGATMADIACSIGPVVPSTEK
jgi:RHS repeat-associated protein